MSRNEGSKLKIIKPLKIANYYYFFRGIDSLVQCNTILIDSKPRILVDTSWGITTFCLYMFLKRHSLMPDYVINTHDHPDHVSGNRLFSSAGAKVLMFNDYGELFWYPLNNALSLIPGIGAGPVGSFRVDMPLFNKDIIPLKDMSLDVIHTPGHEFSSICLYDRKNQVLISGDTIFSGGHVGRWDLPGGSKRQLVKSLSKLLKLDVKYLLPGHMDEICGKEACQKNAEQITKQITKIERPLIAWFL